MEQLTSLCVELGDKDSATRYLASLKSKLADDKASWKEAQVEVEALARAVGDLKKMVEKFASQVPELEEKVLVKLT
jgi:thioredoxin-like negative regulator of GroEL